MGAVLVLASASPRRRELLAQLGVEFAVVTSDVLEIPLPGERPEAFAQRMAREKAWDVARRFPDAFVLAADTVVVVDHAIFGKPAGRDDACRMLQALSGRAHRVLTAVALIDPSRHIDEIIVQSWVEFRQLTAGEIDSYLDSGEPFDKAGAYAVQGLAKTFVRGIRGSRSNVIGLPLDEVADLLRRHMPAAAGAAS